MHIVADTNVLLSAYLFRNSSLVWLREAADAGRVTLILDALTAAELKRVLAYPKFDLPQHAQTSVLARIVVNARVFEAPAPNQTDLPVCRDASDQKFLNLAPHAFAGHPETLLVTGDQDLLALRGQCRFPICRPAELLGLLGPG